MVNLVVSVSGNKYDKKRWVIWKMYISNFSCNILYLVSSFVDLDSVHHYITKIGHVCTSFYGLICNRQILSITTANWVSLFLYCLIHIQYGRLYYIQWITICFISHENPWTLLQLIIGWTERV